MESSQLARQILKTRSYELHLTLTAGVSLPILPYSERRTAIVFCTSPLVNYTVSMLTQTLNTDGHFISSSTGAPLILTKWQHGEMVNKAWFAISAGNGNITVLVTETYAE